MLGINPSYTVGMTGCSECQYCRYLQCHANSPGCRGGPWHCPIQHCGHNTPRASPVALLLSLDLHRPLTEYGLPLQLPIRQHSTDDNKVDNSELYSAVPQEYKKVLESYAPNSKCHNQMGNCGVAQQELKIQENNQAVKQEPYRTLFQQCIKPQGKELNNMHNNQKPKDCSRNLEPQATHLPAIPEGIGIDVDVKGRPSSLPIDIPRDMVPQHKDHNTRRKYDDQSPTPSTHTKHPKKLMDINTCTVSQINQWSNKVLSPQNSKQTKYNKKDEYKSSGCMMMMTSSKENRGIPVKEPYMVQAHVNVKEKHISSTQEVSPVPNPIHNVEIKESEMNDYLTSYKVNQDVKLNDVRINEGFYSVKPPLPRQVIYNDEIGVEVKSPMTITSRPESSFQKDSGNCSDVSSSSVNLGGKSVPSSPSKPHCSMPDYSIDVGVSGSHKELVATSGEGGVGGEDSELGAYWELLEEDIRPLQPLKHSHLSEQIFMEHKEMARNYLILQQELFNLQRQKLLLEEKLNHSEQLEQCTNHRYQDKIRQLMGKRDSLRNNHAHLKQQLECIRNQEKRPLQFAEATPQDITVGASLQLHQPPP